MASTVEDRRAELAQGGAALVAAGDELDVRGQSFLRGHGTYARGVGLQATVTGSVERVNKLISVKPVKTRYSAEAGDVVVGTVTELTGRRWKVDIGSRQDAVLALSAVTLPGGEQRRRTDMDELAMREMYAEGDALMCEVQSVGSDGIAQLHTRSSRFGRLTRGQCVTVPPSLIGRHKPHSHTLSHPLPPLILGRNGIIWVGFVRHLQQTASDENEKDVPMAEDAPSRQPQHNDQHSRDQQAGDNERKLTAEEFDGEARAANAVRALGRAFLPVTPESVQSVCDLSSAQGVRSCHVCGDSFISRLLEVEAQRRISENGAT